eukprot:3911911-Rhodomonas_salina.2
MTRVVRVSGFELLFTIVDKNNNGRLEQAPRPSCGPTHCLRVTVGRMNRIAGGAGGVCGQSFLSLGTRLQGSPSSFTFGHCCLLCDAMCSAEN